MLTNLAFNFIGDEGIEGIVKAMQGLKLLHARQNRITKEAARSLYRGLVGIRQLAVSNLNESAGNNLDTQCFVSIRLKLEELEEWDYEVPRNSQQFRLLPAKRYMNLKTEVSVCEAYAQLTGD